MSSHASAPAAELSPAIEDYLKQICKLELAGERATTSTLAARLGVTPASVTGMAKRLAELHLVDRTPYRGVVLTATGRAAALEVLRHHRLLEQYLARTLGLSLQEAHDEAERLEHAMSEQLERRIDELLGFPTFDPHGDPIPDAKLSIDLPGWRSLSELAEGDTATIRRIPDRDAALLAYLEDISLVPGQKIEVLAVAPLDGPVTVRANRAVHALAYDVAAAIGVD